MAKRRSPLVIIFITIFIDLVGFGIVIPVLPLYAERYHASETVIGLMLASYSMMQFVFAPILGRLSDRVGRRPVLLVSLLGTSLGFLLMGFAHRIPFGVALFGLSPVVVWLFLARIIDGISGGNISTAQAYIADVTPPDERAKRFGLIGAAFGIGFIVGPTVGGLLGTISLRAPFWGAALLSLANAAYGFFILPESLPRERRSPFHWRRANPIGAIQMLRAHPQLFALGIAGFLSMLAHDSLPTTFVLYSMYRYGWTERTIGLILGVFGAALLVVQGGLIGRVVAALGERTALAIGLACGAAGMAIYGLAPSGTLFMLGLPLTALYGLANPSLQSMMTRRVGPSEQGQLQGANGSLNGIANMAAPILFTQIFALAVGRYRDLNLPGAPLLVASLLFVAALAVGWYVTSEGDDRT